jgi:multidrug efflux pump subunit AcrA (membrane-fusion protein)
VFALEGVPDMTARKPDPGGSGPLPVLCGLLLVLSAAGCAGAAAEDVSPRGSSDSGIIGLVGRGSFERELLLTGELEAVRSVAIKSPQTSIFQLRIQFMAEEGTFVEKDDPLLGFDDSSLASQVHELETQILDAETQIVAKRNEIASALKDLEIELAEKNYEHERAGVEASIDREVLSRKEHSEKQLALETAAKALEETSERIELTRSRGKAETDVLIINRDKLRKDLLSTRQDLELLSIQAPAGGLVVYEKRPRTSLRFQEGDSCWPGQGILQLPDLEEMQVAFSVSEVDAPLLKEGDRALISLDAFPGRKLWGEVHHVPSMAIKRSEESKVSIFKVIARLSETWVGEMKPGMSVLGRVVVERQENAPLVARRAVQFDGRDYWLRTDLGESSGSEPERIQIHPLSRNARVYVVSEEELALLTDRIPEAVVSRAARGGES